MEHLYQKTPHVAKANAWNAIGYSAGETKSTNDCIVYGRSNQTEGESVVLLHGFGQTGEMWGPAAEALCGRYRVLVPDLPGVALSRGDRPCYRKTSIAAELWTWLDAQGVASAHVVGHDLGAMVAYSMAATQPDRALSLTIAETPLAGLGPWALVASMPEAWHFNFYDAHALALVEGRERIHLDRFFETFAAKPRQITGPMRALYANAYARPGSMSAAFGYFAAFAADAEDNARLAEQRLAIPVLGLGGERSVGPLIESIVSELATSAQAHIIASAGHWLMEESPERTVQAIEEFLTANPAEPERGLQLSIPLSN